MNHYETIKAAIMLLVKNQYANPSLDELSASLGISESYLRKVFIEWVGISPKQFGRYLSLEFAKNLLKQNKNSLETTALSGLSSGGRLHDLFIDIEAVTPGEYKNWGIGLTVYYSTFDTKFGECLVASTERGICNILFFDELGVGLKDLQSRWPRANVVNESQASHGVVKDYFLGVKPTSKIKLHLRGTNFQIKVWEALLSIPEGNITSYGQIARGLGDVGFSQAVGAAVGDNPVSYIIPCHRVLKATGEISGYRWGVERKRAMLLYESLKKEKNQVNND